MKHAAIPLRRIITEPRVCEPEEFDADEFAFESFVAEAEPDEVDEGDEIQRSAIAEHASMQVRSYGR